MAARVTVKKPNIKIKSPDMRFFGKIGSQLADEIDRRTRRGLDYLGAPFKKYSAAYQKQVGSKRVDLNVTGQMLSSMHGGVRPKKDNVKIRLTGFQGFKAWANEQIGRVFFAMSPRQKDRITKAVTEEFTRKNNLKKR